MPKHKFELEDIVEITDEESELFGKRGVVVYLDCGDGTPTSKEGVWVSFNEWLKWEGLNDFVNGVGVPEHDLHFLKKILPPS